MYKQNPIQIQTHGCWLKQLISPNCNIISVYVLQSSETGISHWLAVSPLQQSVYALPCYIV